MQKQPKEPEQIASLAISIAEFIRKLDRKSVPDAVMRTAQLGIIDCVGTMIAGRDEAAVQVLRKTLSAGHYGEATLYFSSLRAPPPEAAWINGTSAHALDFDDVSIRGHPSTVLVPAILAEGELLDSSGEDLLLAYIAGYETWAELMLREKGLHHLKGWHPTGAFGPIGAAAACARLRGLSVEQTATALAIAASQTCGLVSNFGTMTKPFHAGKAAHSGIMAARLAANGFTANHSVLEHHQGFLYAISQNGEVDLSQNAPALGHEWRLLTHGLNIKKYPTCYATHRTIDGTLKLVEKQGLSKDDVSEVRVSMTKYQSTLLHCHRPMTGLEAKFSIEFAIAAAVVAGRVGLAQLTDEFVKRADVQGMMNKIKVTIAAGTMEKGASAEFDQVEALLQSGQVLQGPRIYVASGHAREPLSENELREKFASCLEVVGMKEDAGQLFDRMSELSRWRVRQLTCIS